MRRLREQAVFRCPFLYGHAAGLLYYSTVRSFYRRARLSGLREKIRGHLVILTRKKAGRKETPTYGLVDSQSVKTLYPSEERGIDGGKKRKDASGIS